MPDDAVQLRVFVVIAVHNRREQTRRCLDQLLRQTRALDGVVVVDDGSTDGTGEMIGAEFARVTVLEGNGELWWTAATNLGARHAMEQGATHVLCLNNDTVPPADLVERLCARAEANGNAVIGAAEVDAVTGERVFAGERVDWKTASYRGLTDNGEVAEVTHLPGRCLLIPVTVFERIGLFDEARFPHYAADYDFTHRARGAGFALLCDRKAVLGVYPELSGDAANRKHKSWGNYRRHLFNRSGGGNLGVFARYAIRNCPAVWLPAFLVAGLSRRIFGYLLEWVSEPEPGQPRVAFVTNLAPHYRVKFFEALAQLCRLDCYFHSDGGEWYWERKHGVGRGSFRGKYLWGFWMGGARIVPGLAPSLLWRRYDVYIKCINDRFALPVTYLAARLAGRPFVLWTGVWMRIDTRVQRLLLPLTLFLYRNADAVVAYGEHVKQYLLSEGVAEERIFVAGQAVDNAQYSRRVGEDEQTALRRKLRIGADAKVLLFVGRLEAVKGVEYLIEGFALARQMDAVLVICGSGSREGELRQLAARLGVEKRVRFTGYTAAADTVVYYSIAWAAALVSVTTPAGRETWGLVANEAFNQGVPVIASDATGAAAGGLVAHRRNGFAVPEGDAAAIASAIRALSADPALRDRLGANARTDVEQWTQRRMAERFRDAARYAMEQRGRRRKWEAVETRGPA